MHIKAIINPAASRVRANAKKVGFILDLLKKKHDVRLIHTTPDASDEQAILKDIHECKTIVVIGGDGTLNRVITYLIRNNQIKPIALIPMGTANVFALECDIPFELKKAVDIISFGKEIFLDVGTIDDGKSKKYFMLMVGVGFDAHAVMGVNHQIKKWSGKGAYVVSGLKTLFLYKPQTILVKSENNEYEAHAAIISNARMYGGKYPIAPHAAMDDGLLDMCLLQAESKLRLITHMLRIIRGTHINANDVVYSKTPTLELDAKYPHDIPFQFDGEQGGFLPIKIGVMPKKIPLLLP